jgi:hypothetical protein
MSPSSPYWEKKWLTGGYNLTVEGIDFIDSRIYDKRKRRWEFLLLAVPTVNGVLITRHNRRTFNRIFGAFRVFSSCVTAHSK